MSNRITDIGKMRNQISAETRPGVFDGKKTARLGTEKNPAVVSVRTEKRRKEVAASFEKNGWAYRIEVDSAKPEDVADLTRLLNPPRPAIAENKVGRNERCPCGSGKKFKNCCGA
ncbi:MAG TPA: PBPRA1643 family SWIM/SEC-C metal-binding motif protein [Candidatus Binatia bacterium]|nr:PBPRA1643 family SWIM/SEC-C metal-binding motif protein [Candidatus Binatia bacterium]